MAEDVQDTGAAPRAPRSRWRLPARFKLLPKKRIDGEQLAAAQQAIARVHAKQWLLARGVIPPSPPLHPAVMQLIADWFDAVDEDGSRTLEHCELLAALKAAHIPCNDMTIAEMIKLMDINGDGVISWDEFKMYMADEFSNGKSLMTGEYILPSGASMNFGVVIGKLRRDKLMKDVLEDIGNRTKWAKVAANPERLAKEFATLTAAAQAAESINNALLLAEKSQKVVYTEDGQVHMTPRTHAAESLLSNMTREARLMKHLSRLQTFGSAVPRSSSLRSSSTATLQDWEQPLHGRPSLHTHMLSTHALAPRATHAIRSHTSMALMSHHLPAEDEGSERNSVDGVLPSVCVRAGRPMTGGRRGMAAPGDWRSISPSPTIWPAAQGLIHLNTHLSCSPAPDAVHLPHLPRTTSHAPKPPASLAPAVSIVGQRLHGQLPARASPHGSHTGTLPATATLSPGHTSKHATFAPDAALMTSAFQLKGIPPAPATHGATACQPAPAPAAHGATACQPASAFQVVKRRLMSNVSFVVQPGMVIR